MLLFNGGVNVAENSSAFQSPQPAVVLLRVTFLYYLFYFGSQPGHELNKQSGF